MIVVDKGIEEKRGCKKDLNWYEVTEFSLLLISVSKSNKLKKKQIRDLVCQWKELTGSPGVVTVPVMMSVWELRV